MAAHGYGSGVGDACAVAVGGGWAGGGGGGEPLTGRRNMSGAARIQSSHHVLLPANKAQRGGSITEGRGGERGHPSSGLLAGHAGELMHYYLK